jgi:cyclopropane-fatty-acyl-phospholipid synthase
MLQIADVRVGGDRPWDLRVHNPAFFRRVLAGGTLAAGETYVAGWWDCDALDEMATRVLRASLDKRLRHSPRWYALVLAAVLTNSQSRARAFEVGEWHYDLGNDFYAAMLDPRMVYTCAYWQNARTLNEAQEAKLDLICRKLSLQRGQHVLDIGCGWGGFAAFAAERYGVHVTGVTVSREQVEHARERCRSLPVSIYLRDYREIEGEYDHVVSIGMFEHVGYKNHRVFMDVVRRCVKEDGLVLLHTIVRNESGRTADPWIERYIFPNCLLPSPRQLMTATEALFVIEDVHNFGIYYDRTAVAWYRNFEENWPRIAEEYGEAFYRMWRYYLLVCAGAFRARKNHLWQVVLSPHGIPEGFNDIRSRTAAPAQGGIVRGYVRRPQPVSQEPQQSLPPCRSNRATHA